MIGIGLGEVGDSGIWIFDNHSLLAKARSILSRIRSFMVLPSIYIADKHQEKFVGST